MHVCVCVCGSHVPSVLILTLLAKKGASVMVDSTYVYSRVGVPAVCTRHTHGLVLCAHVILGVSSRTPQTASSAVKELGSSASGLCAHGYEFAHR